MSERLPMHADVWLGPSNRRVCDRPMQRSAEAWRLGLLWHEMVSCMRRCSLPATTAPRRWGLPDGKLGACRRAAAAGCAGYRSVGGGHADAAGHGARPCARRADGQHPVHRLRAARCADRQRADADGRLARRAVLHHRGQGRRVPHRYGPGLLAVRYSRPQRVFIFDLLQCEMLALLLAVVTSLIIYRCLPNKRSTFHQHMRKNPPAHAQKLGNPSQADRLCRGAADFANGSSSGKFVTSSGQWLDHPMGVLQATNGSANMTQVLVSLAAPRYDATRRTLTFQVRPPWFADTPFSGQ